MNLFSPVWLILSGCNSYIEVDDTEVLLETVAHKHCASVHQVAQLVVRLLERGEMLAGDGGVQVPGLYPRELCQVVHNLARKNVPLQHMDMLDCRENRASAALSFESEHGILVFGIITTSACLATRV